MLCQCFTILMMIYPSLYRMVHLSFIVEEHNYYQLGEKEVSMLRYDVCFILQNRVRDNDSSFFLSFICFWHHYRLKLSLNFFFCWDKLEKNRLHQSRWAYWNSVKTFCIYLRRFRRGPDSNIQHLPIVYRLPTGEDNGPPFYYLSREWYSNFNWMPQTKQKSEKLL